MNGTMTDAVLQFAIAAAVVVVAGSFLARAADRIAELTGLGRLLVGSLLLAGATSLPELGVDLSAAHAGLDDVAVGDLLGSSLCNLLILAVADLVHARRGAIFTRLSEAHALSGMLSVVLTAFVALMLLTRPGERFAFAGVGAGSVMLAAVYLLGVRMVYRDQRLLQARASAPAPHDALPNHRGALARALLRFGIAAVTVLVAAPFLATAAGDIAELSGLGGTFVGTTLVAASTSLPELVATIAAVRMGAFDLAVGNIFGSNTFNMAMLLPVDIVSRGPLLSVASPVHAVTALWVIVITAVAIMGLLYHDPRRRRFIEPDAWAVITLVAIAMGTVYLLA